jgi:DNA-binding protein Fis
MQTIEDIRQGLLHTKSLLTASVLVGEPYTGKHTLIRTLYPHAVYADARDIEALQHALSNHTEVVVENLETAKNIDTLDFDNRRVIAIFNEKKLPPALEEKFAFIYFMPSLKDRLDELPQIAEDILQSIKEQLMCECEVSVAYERLDLEQNFRSLKMSLYKEVILQSLKEEDIENLLEHYFMEHLDIENGYKVHLPLFEKPLLRAGLKKYKSQLKLAKALGINRNTLRKKIYEHDLD